ncbi:MAG: type II toxin-antitoxin system VapC family toxin [Anaerolineales bacterium]|nr:type II toxin-antitoxin system VapC family toxin [Anaerolineales bacterium]NUQ85849.1 type II toxin-antitoxin system VapC family toxin [Anaerolineales bacterium]
MIFYFDTSALLKAYVQENSSKEVIALMDEGDNLFGSIVLTKVEMASAIQRAIRATGSSSANAAIAWQDFLDDWQAFTRLRVTAGTIERASDIAWKHGLRGYDSLHLAAALLWQESLDTSVVFAAFDHDLLQASKKTGLEPWPPG